MSILDGSFVGRARRVLAVVAVLQFILIVPRAARADVESVADMVARVSPAVVRVVTVRPPQPMDELPGASLASTPAKEGTTTAVGSGFIIDPTGYIATNRHVVDGAIALYVVTAEGVRYEAAISGMPPESDMALLRIYAGRKLPFVSFGDSDKTRVGDRVIAIGTPFGLFDTSVSSGIVSGVNRDIMESPFDDYIQTDAAINHGNSGGPLFNLEGEVIGMNSVLYAPGPGSAGVGFAIPSNSLKFVFGRIMKTGEVRAGMLPIHTQQVTWMLEQALDTGDLQGALVKSVQDDAGTMLQGKIQPGDVIRTFNGHQVQDPRDLARMAAMAPIGSDAALEICRGSEREIVHVTIQAWPEVKHIVLDDDRNRSLGLQLAAAEGANDRRTVKVVSVDPNGTAAGSGIHKDDIIVEVQQTQVSDPDQALRILWARSSLKLHFAAVLVQRDGKRTWMALAVPD
jgi:serine protease Do